MLKVRDFLRWAKGDEWRVEALEERLKISKGTARKVLSELITRGWVARVPPTKWEPRRRWYQRTLAGGALASARAVPPISRAGAKIMMEEFLKRVAEINARDELAYVVKQVRVFGSYLDKSKRALGDIDLVVDLEQRQIEGREIVSYNLERARGSGKQFNSSLDLLFYGEIEMLRLLKGGNNYISFHPESDLRQTSARPKVIFPTKLSRAKATRRRATSH